MNNQPLLDQLIDALKLLPGVGQKTAQRMALHLLKIEPKQSRRLGNVILDAVDKIQKCQRCQNYTEMTECVICTDTSRKKHQLCVVESPTDLLAIESGTSYRGMYFVLLGKLSPLDGVGPADIGLNKLEARIQSGELEEVILATSSTMEGEVTAHVISDMVKKQGLSVTRLAQGVPVGGELEYLDLNTLTQAFDTRREY